MQSRTGGRYVVEKGKPKKIAGTEMPANPAPRDAQGKRIDRPEAPKTVVASENNLTKKEA